MKILIVLLYSVSFFINLEAVQHSKSLFIDNTTSQLYVFTFDGASLYIPNSNDIVQRDFETTQVVRTLSGHSSKVVALFLLNSALFSFSIDGQILQWDLYSGGIVKRIHVKCGTSSVAPFHNDSLLVTCATGSSLLVNMDGEVLHTFDANPNFYVYQDFIYAYAASTTDSMYLYCYQYLNFTRITVYSGPVSVVIRQDDYIYGADDITHQIFEVLASDLALNATFFTGAGHTASVESFLIIDSFLVSGGSDFRLLLWDRINQMAIGPLNCNYEENLLANLIEFMFYYNETSFFAASSAGPVVLCDIKQNDTLKKYAGEQVILTSLAIYGDTLLSGSTLVDIKRWSITSGELQPAFQEGVRTCRKMFVLSNLLLTCRDSIMLIDLAAATIVKNFAVDEVLCWYLSYSNGFAYAPTIYHSIGKYNLTSGENVLQFYSEKITLYTILFSFDTYLFASFSYMDLTQWNCITGSLQHIYKNFNVDSSFDVIGNVIVMASGGSIKTVDPASNLIQVLFSYKNDYMLSLFYDKLIDVVFIAGQGPVYGYDLRNSNEMIYTFIGHSDYVYDLVVQGDFVFSCSADGTVKKWSVNTKRIVYSFEDRSKAVTSLTILGNNLFFGTEGGKVFIFEIYTAFYKYSLSLNNGSISSVISDDQVNLFVSGLDGKILLINPFNASFTKTLVYNSIPKCLAYFEGFLFIGNQDFTILIINYESEKVVKILVGHDAIINDILVDGIYLLSAGGDDLICRWIIEAASIDLKYKGHSDQVTSLIKKENLLFSSSLDKTVIKWDFNSAIILQVFRKTGYILGHLGPINQIIFCNGMLFSASMDLTIKQWDINSGQILDTLFGHTKAVTCLSCLNKALFSGSLDFSVLLWYPNFPDSSTLSAKISSTIATSVDIADRLHGTFPPLFVYIIIAVLGLFVIIILVLGYFKGLQYYKRNDRPAALKLDSSSSETSVSVDITLFTQFPGMAIPAYLEKTSSSFRLLTQINKGGGGAIFVADLLQSGEKIIAKVVNQNYDEMSLIMRLSFDQEITLMDFLKSHKNIAKIVGFCRKPCCVLMKYYEKGSLNDLIYKNRGYSMRQWLKFVNDISHGIAFMHSKFIVHGDLKPDNVLVDYDDNGTFMVLTDFGIAQILSDKVLASKSFRVANLRGLSVHYAAPEVFKSFRRQGDGKILPTSDLYSFVMIVYEIMSRKTPWS